MQMPRRTAQPQAAAQRQRDKRWAKDRDAWAHLNEHEFTLFIGNGTDDDTYAELDGVPSVRAGVRLRSHFTFVNLTSLTVDELDVVRAFWDRACDAAEPFCRQLDAIADRNFEENSDDNPDTLMRLYRQSPVLIVDPRRQRRDDPGLQVGPDAVVEVAGDEPESGAVSGGSSSPVPDDAPKDLGRAHDVAKTDRDPVLGKKRGRPRSLFKGFPDSDAK